MPWSGARTIADATRNRWPLAVTTSSDGQTFNTAYLAVAGDIPQERYETDQRLR